ncbi:MAG: aldo/keto reductase [Acidobacteria bacterium]|nr:aldo/keto reductase [Acidobacteriota bacterium]
MSWLGIGSAPMGDADAAQQEVDRIVAAAIDEGINYFDTAPIYEQAEVRLGRALKGKRQKVFLVTKVETTTRQDAQWQVRDSLRRLETDYLDAVHIHNVGRTDRFPSLEVLLGPDGALEGLKELKKKGIIRHIGMTCHLRPKRALPVLETGAIELVMCAANFVDVHTYNFEGTVFEAARDRGLGIVAMKVLGGAVGNGASQHGKLTPDHYTQAMRYALGIPGLSVAIVGMRRMSDLKAALDAVRAYKPFTPAEWTELRRQGQLMAREWGELRGPVA